jgi:SAM-dependent methyltransferase
MVMSTLDGSRSPGGPSLSAEDRDRGAQRLPTKVIWHDLECGSYRADLTLWRKLAGISPGAVLDIGAGTGRVTLDLARAPRQVTALDLDPDLLDALRERSVGLDVETVCADARSFELPVRDFGLCLMPMQTIQLLSDATERAAFLRCALAHLRPGGLLACAIVTELDPFDIAADTPGPSPEIARFGGTLYESQATSVRVLHRHIVIERERRIIPAAVAVANEESIVGESAGQRDVIELARLSASELERESSQVGFHPEAALEIDATDEHVGSTVVMLRA